MRFSRIAFDYSFGNRSDTKTNTKNTINMRKDILKSMIRAKLNSLTKKYKTVHYALKICQQNIDLLT